RGGESSRQSVSDKTPRSAPILVCTITFSPLHFNALSPRIVRCDLLPEMPLYRLNEKEWFEWFFYCPARFGMRCDRPCYRKLVRRSVVILGAFLAGTPS